ncbi:MAG TPA: L,D-transpeptidase family protein [Vicinamibacterales bacterium]|nr:L,D-transpeptidase family protein [Vicinamibacterales bacterium]
MSRFLMVEVETLAAVLLLALLNGASIGRVQNAPAPLSGSRQLLLVVTDAWGARTGTLQRLERAAPDAVWVGGARLPVVVGRNGLAWDPAAPDAPPSSPVKEEGDGRAPAGVFALGTSFGLAAQCPAGWRVPYRPLGDNVECVTDVRSPLYNRLVTREEGGGALWERSEKMWREPLYVWGLVVGYNVGPVRPGGGSCIFLHAWDGPDSSTAGCTAMARDDLVETLGWLDPGKQPRLVQLPRSEYERLKSRWGLP